jgi:hypothetical protein
MEQKGAMYFLVDIIKIKSKKRPRRNKFRIQEKE